MIPQVLISYLTHQSENKIKKSLESVLNQNYKYYELIISDNGSTDNTKKILAKNYPQIKKIYNSNIGYGKAHNKIIHYGINNTHFQYILILNDDILLEKNYLSRCIEKISKDKQIAGVTGKIFEMSDFNFINNSKPSIDFYKLNSYYKIKKTKNNLSSSPTGIIGAAPLFSVSALKELNGYFFDPHYFLYHEDIDLCWRLWKKGYKFDYAIETQAIHLRSYSFSKRKSVPIRIRRLVYLNRYYSIIKNATRYELYKNFIYLLLYESAQFLYLLFFDPKCIDIYFEFFNNYKKIKKAHLNQSQKY